MSQYAHVENLSEQLVLCGFDEDWVGLLDATLIGKFGAVLLDGAKTDTGFSTVLQEARARSESAFDPEALAADPDPYIQLEPEQDAAVTTESFEDTGFVDELKKTFAGLNEIEHGVMIERFLSILPVYIMTNTLKIKNSKLEPRKVLRDVYGSINPNDWQPSNIFDPRRSSCEKVALKVASLCRGSDSNQLALWANKRLDSIPRSPLIFLATANGSWNGPDIPHDMGMADLRKLASAHLAECEYISPEAKPAIAMRYGLTETETPLNYEQIAEALNHPSTKIIGWDKEFYALRLILDPAGRNIKLAHTILRGPDRSRPGWVRERNCKYADPENLFVQGKRQHEVVRALCKKCIVVTECLADAIVQPEQWGVAGMMTERERNVVRGMYMADDPGLWARRMLAAQEAALNSSKTNDASA